jgi:hypothetical protein
VVRILQPDTISEFDVKFRDTRGSLVDVTTPTVAVYDFSNVLVLTTTSTFTPVTTGHYRHLLNPSVITTQGTYRALFYGTYSGQKIFADGPEIFEIKYLTDVYTYASVREVVDYAEIVEPVDILLLRTLVQVATSIINDYCSRQFRNYTVTEELHVLESVNAFHLLEYPVISISAITLDSRDVDASLYTLDKATGRVRWNNSPVSGDAVVTYVAGVDSVPDAINLVCMKIASYLYFRKKREGLSSESLLGYSYHMLQQNDPSKPRDPIILECQDLLDNYKLVRIH